MPRIIEGKRMNITGNKVKEFRKERNLSQQELSNQLETLAVYICRGSISRTVTDIELAGLSEILHVPVERFFER